MKEKTKEIFAAPWMVKYQVHECWGTDFEIGTTDGMRVAISPTEEHANRILHLPELYDALVDAALGRCWACSGIGSDILESGCPKKNDTTCYVAKWLELLRKVRDGEK